MSTLMDIEKLNEFTKKYLDKDNPLSFNPFQESRNIGLFEKQTEPIYPLTEYNQTYPIMADEKIITAQEMVMQDIRRKYDEVCKQYPDKKFTIRTEFPNKSMSVIIKIVETP